ncbi:hypothetical protein VN12_11620 [Pirellula sp. SH-Sr6A]|uniref:DUF4404 family protein n=1 Tax=Pirellula sp. SH-Sr6A TaxID=1632865 RepID=UPI00078EB207|nr:DUF4404 family protein [Pirellula sp. SH-Sr6A]AMV32765.1 hypothetical protein VN12_11620 [Pirellula sp. SH-Sr6A]
MSNELIQTLQRLHEQLHTSSELDNETRESLKRIAQEIQDSLEASGENTLDSSLSSRLQAWVDELEVNHPQLTKIVSQVVERLADMGI